MATIVTKIVDTGGGEGADYTSLAAWEAAEQCDLVAQNKVKKVLCRATTGVADSTPVTLEGWTTDSDHYPWITTEIEHRHQGVWGYDYRMVNTKLNDKALICAKIPNYIIEGLQFYGVAQAGKIGRAILHVCEDPGVVKIKKNIFRSQTYYGGTSRNYGIDIQSSNSGSIFYIQNNLLYDFKGDVDYATAIRYAAPVGRAWVDHNTVYNANFGYWSKGAERMHCRFCIASSCRDGYKGTFGGGSNKNVSDIAGDAPGDNPITGTPIYLDASNNKYDLQCNDTIARNKIVTPIHVVDDDIIGRARPVMTYSDCGCFEHTPINIVITDTSQTHSVDNIAYTQTHVFQINECLLEYTVDGPFVFSQLHIVSINEANLAMTAENCSVNIVLTLEIQDALFEHIVDGDLEFDRFLNFVIQEALMGHTVENMKFTQLHTMVINDATLEHTVDQCAANTRVNIIVADASLGHTVEGDLVFAQQHILEIDNAIMQILAYELQINPTGRRIIVLLGPEQTVEQVDTRLVINRTPTREVTVDRETLGD